MTLIQQARVAGFRAQLAVRGITVTLLPDRGSFPAPVEQYQGPQPGSVADAGSGTVEPELRQAVRLAILLADLGDTAVQVGDVLRDTGNATDYRVVRIERGGIDIAARFTCEREAA
ncbi:MAG TPA: hypothetical protein PKM73_18925 [Verrucomicrobiota bacterium]|nr:hypothetical protein [Verrucomicrobiota bacterium]HNU53337.1 hypothetical protein [Verrucomicrobiota bacterium]